MNSGRGGTFVLPGGLLSPLAMAMDLCYNRPMSVNARRKDDTTLCRNFCRYYKPGKNEELSCRGFVVVHRILRKGRKLPLERPETLSLPDAGTVESLRNRLCRACDFHEGECDFVLTGTATPCGGFILLAHLLGTGELTLAEIEAS